MDLPVQLAAAVTTLSWLHERVVVGIDGPDGAGKTTLADRLADALHVPTLKMPTLRVSVDRFNRPHAQRYQRGELSADGYYLDSFDYPALLNQCLLPFLGGEDVLRTTTRDHLNDAQETIDAVAIPTRAVFVLDGVFLLRPELRELWTLSVYLRVSPEETLRRAHRRDLGLFGSAEVPMLGQQRNRLLTLGRADTCGVPHAIVRSGHPAVLVAHEIHPASHQTGNVPDRRPVRARGTTNPDGSACLTVLSGPRSPGASSRR